MRMKALSPNYMIRRHLTTQDRVTPPKMPNKDTGHHKDEGNRQQRITGKTILPESSKACTTRVFIYKHETGAAKQKLA
jgi:hypothetical protein